jgi:hypothetical protein
MPVCHRPAHLNVASPEVAGFAGAGDVGVQRSSGPLTGGYALLSLHPPIG